MKKVISLFVFVSAFVVMSTVSASAESTSGLGIGFHGGANFSDLSVKRSGTATLSNSKENNAGLLLGAHLELGTEFFVIRPEVNYSVRGYTLLGAVEVTQKFLEIPVLAKVSFLPGAIQPFIEAGPQFGFHLSDDVSLLGGVATFDNDSSTLDLSGVAGAGLRFALSENVAVEGEGRYVFGFTDQNSRDDIEVKTRGFQLLAGLTFRY